MPKQLGPEPAYTPSQEEIREAAVIFGDSREAEQQRSRIEHKRGSHSAVRCYTVGVFRGSEFVSSCLSPRI